jgi:electron transfer flavoprotein beta subunit
VRIIACIKAVPGYIVDPTVSENHDKINYDAGSIVVNESDEFAIEEGVKLAKKSNGNLTVMTAGSLASQKVLQTGLGKDADKAVRIDIDLFEPGKTAQALAEAIKHIGFDLVLTGVESSDLMAAQVGVNIAALLSIPFAYAVTDIEISDDKSRLKITKELGHGLKQVEEIPLPAVLCLQTGTVPPSFVPIRKMLLAQSKPIKTLNLSDLGLEETFMKPSFKISEIMSPQEMSQAEIISGEPDQVASKLVKKIKEAM